MTWSEQWSIADDEARVDAASIAALLGDALEDRGVGVGPSIVHEGVVLEGATVESFGRYVTVALGLGELRGSFTFARADGDDPAYASISSDELHGPWEPMYVLFTELARALGATPEPAIASELDPDELAEDVRATVDACLADALYAQGLEAGDAALTASSGDEPLEAFDVAVEFHADSIAVHVTGAGERFEVTVRGLAVALTPEARAAITGSLRGELAERIAYHRSIRHQHAAPAAAPERAGRLFLVTAAGAEELTDLDHLRRAVAERSVDVIRYFSTGEPFWKAVYDPGHPIEASALDELHGDRTWQWADADATG